MGKDLVVYSGYTLEQLLEWGKEDPAVLELLRLCDTLQRQLPGRHGVGLPNAPVRVFDAVVFPHKIILLFFWRGDLGFLD